MVYLGHAPEAASYSAKITILGDEQCGLQSMRYEGRTNAAALTLTNHPNVCGLVSKPY